jgi:hypothetical protein
MIITLSHHTGIRRNIKEFFYYLLTAIGLMPGGSVTKIGRTYKETQGNETYNSRKSSISHKISQYSTSATNRIQGTINRIQDRKHRKTAAYTETTKHENKEKNYCRELNPGRQACSSTLPYELSGP